MSVCPHVNWVIIGHFSLRQEHELPPGLESSGTTSPPEGAQSHRSVSFIVLQARLCLSGLKKKNFSCFYFLLILSLSNNPETFFWPRRGQYLQVSVKMRNISLGAASFSCWWLSWGNATQRWFTQSWVTVSMLTLPSSACLWSLICYQSPNAWFMRTLAMASDLSSPWINSSQH